MTEMNLAHLKEKPKERHSGCLLAELMEMQMALMTDVGSVHPMEMRWDQPMGMKWV